MNIHLLELGLVEAREGAKVLHDAADALGPLAAVRNHRMQVGDRVLVINLALERVDLRAHVLGQCRAVVERQQPLDGVHGVGEEIHVAVDEPGWVVQLVRDARGQLPERSHLLAVNYLCLKSFQLGLAPRQLRVAPFEVLLVAPRVA
jgi:hypothetical protein